MTKMEGTQADGAAPGMARCELHGLHYPVPDPGCVGGRRAAGLSVAPAPEPRVRRARLLAGVTAGALLLLCLTAAALKLRRTDDIRVGVPDAAAADDFVDCVRTCAEANETCATACPEGELAAACGTDCLAAYSECS